MATPEGISLCVTLLVSISVTFLILGLVCAIMIGILYSRRLRLKELEIVGNAEITDKITKVLELVIQDCFSDYQILRLIPLNEDYITEDREQEIRRDLVDMVSTRISPYTLEKLSLIYNPAHIAEVISDKIYITVMEYVLSVNMPYNEEELNGRQPSVDQLSQQAQVQPTAPTAS